MVKEASEEREAEKAGIQTAEQCQAVLALDKIQLTKANEQIETEQKAAEAIQVLQDKAMLTLTTKLEGEDAVVVRCEQEVALATKSAEALAAKEAANTPNKPASTGSSNSSEKQAVQALLAEREADLLAAKVAREETQGQIRRLKTDEEIIAQSRVTIPQAQKFYRDLLAISQRREEDAIAQSDR